jgi:hypothetical protein
VDNATVTERNETHGDFYANALAYDAVNPLRFPLDMIRVKMIRAAQGDATFDDHWIDIIGYAEIGLAIARRIRSEKEGEVNG